MTSGPPSRRPAGGLLAPPLVSGLTRALSATWRVERHGAAEFDAALSAGPAVIAFWHGEQLPQIGLHGGRGLVGMTSLSKDGELVAQAISRLGYGVVRGSTSRGGSSALRTGLRALADGRSLALAVDGPRGPRHQPHGGAVALAVRGRVPLLYAVCAARPAVQLKTWDRMLLPLPLARVVVWYGRVELPEGRGRDSIEAGTDLLRKAMLELGETAAAAL